MRRAYQNQKFIEEGNDFYGLSLGFDFCAEHEWGIEDMKCHFGIVKENGIGLPSRKISKHPIQYFENGNFALLTSRTPWNLKDKTAESDILESHIPYDLKNFTTYPLACAWDGEDFCVIVNGTENREKLRELKTAFENDNIAICTIKSNLTAFAKTSLSLLIADKLPQEIIDDMYNADKEYWDIYEYEEKIGLKELKETKGKKNGYQGDKYYMACSPKWIDYKDEKNREFLKKQKGTKYDIMYWVNYSDDDDNYGWYTVEQIQKWLSTPGLKLKSLNKR
jgi:hypothetical protein